MSSAAGPRGSCSATSTAGTTPWCRAPGIASSCISRAAPRRLRAMGSCGGGRRRPAPPARLRSVTTPMSTSTRRGSCSSASRPHGVATAASASAPSITTGSITCMSAILRIAGLAALLAACGRGSAGTPLSGPDTVFVEDFESGTLKGWSDGVDTTRQRVVTDSAFAQSGHRYLAVTYPAGGDGGWLTHFLTPAYDSLFVSYWVRFPPTWVGGTKLLALYGSRSDDRWSAFGKAGICPKGDDFFMAMVITEMAGNPGATRFYTYYPAMKREPDRVTCWGRY